MRSINEMQINSGIRDPGQGTLDELQALIQQERRSNLFATVRIYARFLVIYLLGCSQGV